jgi:hypothetical protein
MPVRFSAPSGLTATVGVLPYWVERTDASESQDTLEQAQSEVNKDTYVRLGSEIGARSAYRTFSRTFIPPEQSNLQNVFTEYWLCRDIVSKLEECAGTLKDKDWKVLCLNLEFVEIFLHEFGVKAENVEFLTDCQRKGEFASLERYKGVKVHVTKDMLNWRADVKFDIVVGNPPYHTVSN